VSHAVEPIDEIFWQAAQFAPGADRQAYLAAACRDDATLRKQVDRLLRVHPKLDRFLEQPFAGPAPRADVADVGEAPGTVIGPYKLLEQIGEGGMGAVFMAEQVHPVRRRVALKVIKPGLDTAQVVARFEAERQALALMDHPNIARVFDAGSTDRGRPYFVMEFVKGRPITEYCDAEQLPLPDRLRLFVGVCQAVQHAHQKGVIHRDLKPANVLVESYDGRPVPKVIDFGIAKALGQELTDKTLHTWFAQIIGTPLYMSPEQAAVNALEVDTRSDVYSLGVLLYELLTGTTPFDKDRFKTIGYDELRRIIREEEPPRPSTRLSTLGLEASTISTNRGTEPRKLSAVVRGELDWVVIKALEKDRSRRYETANGLVMDIQRYLSDEPVSACPPSAWYRMRKFARRNSTGLAVAGLVLLVLGLLGAGGWWWRQEQAARGIALAARQAETERTVTAALAQAETLLAEGDRQLDQPERRQSTTQLARAAQEKAEELLAAGVAADELTERVRQVRAAVEAAAVETRLLIELDRIRLEQAAVTDGHFDTARAAPLYAKALGDYLDPRPGGVTTSG
jgi:eukaryotic-like serine/threonine-protein kinase